MQEGNALHVVVGASGSTGCVVTRELAAGGSASGPSTAAECDASLRGCWSGGAALACDGAGGPDELQPAMGSQG